MQREVENRSKKDEQDILWEELEEQFESIRKAYRKGRLNLNQVVIEKSALYLKVENYIDNVKDKTEVKNIEAERKLKHRRLRKYKSNKIANLDTVRLTTSVDEFLLKNTDIENQCLSKKYRNSAIEIDEEIKIPDDLNESNVSNHYMISFEKLDNKSVKASMNKETEDEVTCSPMKFSLLKPEGYKNEASEDNESEQDSISKIELSKSRQSKFTDIENSVRNKASRSFKSRRSSVLRKSVDAPFENSDQECERPIDTNSKELQDYYKEISKVSKSNKRKGIGRKVKIGAIHDQPIKRKRKKKAKMINLNKTEVYNDKLEQSVNLESMFNVDTFGNDDCALHNRTQNDIDQIHGSNKMLFVKNCTAKGKKFDSRYEHRLSSRIGNDEDQNFDIQVQDFEESKNYEDEYTQNKIETIKKSKMFCNNSKILGQDQINDESKVNSVHILS